MDVRFRLEYHDEMGWMAMHIVLDLEVCTIVDLITVGLSRASEIFVFVFVCLYQYWLHDVIPATAWNSFYLYTLFALIGLSTVCGMAKV